MVKLQVHNLNFTKQHTQLRQTKILIQIILKSRWLPTNNIFTN